jgi:hypothetical protein
MMTEREKYLRGMSRGDLTNDKREHLAALGIELTDKELRNAPDSILMISSDQSLTPSIVRKALRLLKERQWSQNS